MMKFSHYKKILVVLCSLMVVQCTCPWLNSIDFENAQVQLLSTHEMRFCYISFVMIDGKKYLIKQKKSDCIRKLMGVVRDAVMAHFAEGFINAHQVDIIPAGKAFPGKPRTDWPATIHTIAPGKMIKAQKSRYRHMNLQQRDSGFTLEMLQWMLKDEMLMRIVAFDIFLCNHDRHRGNLFYNPVDDSFCAIDMDSAWKYNVSAFACKNLKKMLNSRKLHLKSKEIKAFIILKEYLQFLIKKYNPADVINLYDYFVEKAGFVEGAGFYLPKFADEMRDNKKMIMESYEDVKQLVQIIEILVKKS